MKRTLLWACVAASALLASCGGEKESGKITLNNVNDSLSYSIGLYASGHLYDMVREDMGIEPAVMDNFIAGVRESFPLNVTPESRAYAYGLSLGAAAMDMLRDAGAMVAEVDESCSLDSRLFLEGLVDAVCGTGGIMKPADAADYYKQCRYRKESDTFMQRNAKRSNVTTLPGGLQYKVDTMGKGPVAADGDNVMCIYKGSLVDGRVFDTTEGEAVTLPVSGVIPGFAQALKMFPVGTKCTIYIPWELAYGEKGTEGVPAYSALVFDLEITGIKKNKKQ